MAQVDVSTSSELDPESAWKLASDLNRFHEWLTIFGGWRSEVPTTDQGGNLRVVVHQSEGFPQRHPLDGHPVRRAGRDRAEGTRPRRIRIALKMNVADDQPGSTFHLDADCRVV